MKKYSTTIFFVLFLVFFIGITGYEQVYASENYSDVQFQKFDQLFDEAVSNYEKYVYYEESGIEYQHIEEAYNQLYDEGCPYSCFISSIRIFSNGTIELYYNNEFNERTVKKYSKAIKDETNKILGLIDSDWTDLQKILFVHDYIAKNYKYNYDGYLEYVANYGRCGLYTLDFNFAGLAVNGEGVCQAYAETFSYIMKQLGIESHIVTSTSMCHAWNKVKLNGKYYHIDITWDDPTYDTMGSVLHKYFLLSDSAMKDDVHEHYKWDNEDMNPACDTTYDNYFWTGVTTPFTYYENYWYYINYNGNSNYSGLYKYNMSNNKRIKVSCLDDSNWNVVGEACRFYPGIYSGIVASKSGLFINDSTNIYKVDTATGELTSVFTLPVATQKCGYIYGISKDSDSIIYEVKSCNSEKGNIYDSNVYIDTEELEYEGESSKDDVEETIVTFNLANTFTATYSKNYKKKLEVTDVYTNDISVSLKKTWSSSNTKVVTVDGEGNITVVGAGNAVVSCTIAGVTEKCNVTINRKSIGKSFSISNKTYTGKAITPSVTITDKDSCGNVLKLVKNVDYTISYKNNTNIGLATVTITGKGNYTSSMSTTFKILPKQPSGVKATANDSSSITIKWSSVGGGAGYKIYMYDASSKSYKYMGSTTSTSYKKTGLKASTKYYFKVYAYRTVSNKTYTGSASSVVSATTKAAVTVAKVSGLKQTSSYATNSVKMSWTKVSGASGYEVYRATSKNGKYSKVGTTTSVSFTNKSLSAGKTYYYKVRAYKKSNGKTYYGSFSNTVYMVTKTSAPSKVTLSTGSKQAKVTWSKATGAKGYEVYMSTKKNSGYSKIKTATSSTTSYTKAKLTKNKTYYFKVRSYTTTASGSKVYSGWSTIKSVKIK